MKTLIIIIVQLVIKLIEIILDLNGTVNLT